jgi:hypothetical protein
MGESSLDSVRSWSVLKLFYSLVMLESEMSKEVILT